MCVKCENESVTETIWERHDDVEIIHEVCEECHAKFMEGEDEMEKDEKLEMAKKIAAMIELGASVDVSFFNISPDKAEAMAKQLNEEIGESYKVKKYEKYDSYNTPLGADSPIRISVFTTDYKGETNERSA